MYRYKLKELYPGLPTDWKVGMYLGLGDGKITYSPESIVFSDGPRYSQSTLDMFGAFWEKHELPTWEILAFKYTNTGSIVTRMSDEKYVCLSSEDYKNDGKGVFDVDYFLKNKNYEIFKVSRFSDGLEITLGDRVSYKARYNNVLGLPWVVTKFSINNDGNKMMAEGKFVKSGEASWSDINNPSFKVLPTPVYTATDGVELFKNDKIYFLTKNYFEVKSYVLDDVNIQTLPQLKNQVTFADESTAKLFAEDKLNEKQFSVQDIINLWKNNKTWKPGGEKQIIEKLLK